MKNISGPPFSLNYKIHRCTLSSTPLVSKTVIKKALKYFLCAASKQCSHRSRRIQIDKVKIFPSRPFPLIIKSNAANPQFDPAGFETVIEKALKYFLCAVCPIISSIGRGHRR
jgi:hypothetical protein